MKKLLMIFILFSAAAYPQKKDPEEILNKVKAKFESVNDYVVDVNVKVDVEFLKVPPSNATIYFKQPDKVHIESDKFAMLPKEGLNFSPLSFLKKKYTPIFEGEENYKGAETYVIKIIPIGNDGDIVLSTFWIDKKEYIIRKVESATKIAGTFTIEMDYPGIENKYHLPSQMVFSFDVSKSNLPASINDGMNPDDPPQKDKKGKKGVFKTAGKVTINYSNYKVNKGIDDSIFEEKKKK
ncbi:MAG: outer membrane lipoprotein-sorting protein [Ignavibacteriaceae bacterium]|nr:outer membrane lipoprotein-sorting protein [Ignavibacteriaceae bacterium]